MIAGCSFLLLAEVIAVLPYTVSVFLSIYFLDDLLSRILRLVVER